MTALLAKILKHCISSYRFGFQHCAVYRQKLSMNRPYSHQSYTVVKSEHNTPVERVNQVQKIHTMQNQYYKV